MLKDTDLIVQNDLQDKPEPGLRDHIRAAMDEVKEKSSLSSDKPDAKLDAKPELVIEAKDTPKEDKTPAKAPEKKAEEKEPEQLELPLDDKKQPDKKAEEVDKDRKESKAPFGTPKEIRAEWSTLNQNVQGYVSKLLKENLDLKSESGRKSYLRDVDAVLQPYMPALQQHKASPAVLVKRLLEYSDALGSSQYKYAAIAQLANDFGIDLSLFGNPQDQQGKQTQSKGAQTQDPPEYYIPPEIDQKLDTVLDRVNKFEEAQRTSSDISAKNYVDSWGGFNPTTNEYTKRPYFPYVRQAMYQLIATGAVPIENGTVDLDKAYETACFMNQEIRERVTEDYRREQAVAAEKVKQEQVQKAQRAKFAGSSIRTSAPIPARNDSNKSDRVVKHQSIRDSIAAALEQHRA